MWWLLASGKCKSHGVFHFYSLQNRRNYIVGKVNRVGWEDHLGFKTRSLKYMWATVDIRQTCHSQEAFSLELERVSCYSFQYLGQWFKFFWDVYFINAIFTRYSSFLGHNYWTFWKDDSFSLALSIVIKRFPWMEIGYALSKSTYPKWKI